MQNGHSGGLDVPSRTSTGTLIRSSSSTRGREKEFCPIDLRTGWPLSSVARVPITDSWRHWWETLHSAERKPGGGMPGGRNGEMCMILVELMQSCQSRPAPPRRRGIIWRAPSCADKLRREGYITSRDVIWAVCGETYHEFGTTRCIGTTESGVSPQGLDEPRRHG
ncbi:hypothetical protein GQ53DRAFT_96666 [Thozetella sp. PMI_491]|nr:hypothetical protein GQ53DRAFT_96666 [Thozetella sp. PMI_491]